LLRSSVDPLSVDVSTPALLLSPAVDPELSAGELHPLMMSMPIISTINSFTKPFLIMFSSPYFDYTNILQIACQSQTAHFHRQIVTKNVINCMKIHACGSIDPFVLDRKRQKMKRHFLPLRQIMPLSSMHMLSVKA
jgi:hypothetical protein